MAMHPSNSIDTNLSQILAAMPRRTGRRTSSDLVVRSPAWSIFYSFSSTSSNELAPVEEEHVAHRRAQEERGGHVKPANSMHFTISLLKVLAGRLKV